MPLKLAFVLNPAIDIGKAQIATILEAKAAGAPLGVLGNNTSNISGAAEDILYI